MTYSGLAGTTLGSRRRRRWQGRGRWQGRATATWFLRLIFCLDLHLWMCRRERPWPGIGWYQFLNFLNLPQVIRTLLPDVAGWWEGDVETAKAAWQFAILSQPSAVVILDNFAIFLPPGFLLVRKTQTDRTARRFLVTMVRLAMRLHGWRWTSATSKSCHLVFHES